MAAWRAQGLWPDHPVGISLGKSRSTPLAQAPEDYANSLRVLWPHGDFFVVNVSSPNTPDLRKLQDKAALDAVLAAVQEANRVNSRESRDESRGAKNLKPEIRNPKLPKPILVKVAPDLSLDALDEILELFGPRQIAGIVATNTTGARPQTDDPRLQRIYAEAGGLSGKPLRARSTEVIRHIHRQTRGQVPVIGVGGIFSAQDAWDKITAGAALVEIYTGLVYEGPGVVKNIVAGLIKRLETAGVDHLREVIGSA